MSAAFLMDSRSTEFLQRIRSSLICKPYMKVKGAMQYSILSASKHAHTQYLKVHISNSIVLKKRKEFLDISLLKDGLFEKSPASMSFVN